MGSVRAIINLDPMDRVVQVNGDHRMTIVGVPDNVAAARAALELIGDGARSVELCGGFGPAAAARVIEAIDGRVPVGTVMFGMESLTSVARYKLRAESGERLAGAFLYLQQGADPAIDRAVREHEGGTATFVAVPDAAAAPAVAAELVADGAAQLIELYGGFTPVSAARVIAAAGPDIPVGLVGYPAGHAW
ncbi:DUF6506 family protein [Nonomuraea sp. NPDC046570]|uniref:DUF6506 family protein n=1 Tax=Nonomuraea sp. NPDC046570 TaxID=3155255 RepID=UPI0033E0C213